MTTTITVKGETMNSKDEDIVSKELAMSRMFMNRGNLDRARVHLNKARDIFFKCTT